MSTDKHTTLFLVILLANSATLLLIVIAAIKFPSWSYRLIGIVSLAAFLLSVHQCATEKYQPATLVLSALSSGLITLRVAANLKKYPGR